VGANIFIGNLDPDVDEKLLYDTFSAFGVIISTPKIMRDPETGGSKGFGFIGFESFESSDSAIASMNGQFLSGRPISVSYALKKDSKGDRHGSAAERLLAANNPTSLTRGPRPTTNSFNSPPPVPPQGVMYPPPPPPGMMGFAPPPPPGYGMMQWFKFFLQNTQCFFTNHIQQLTKLLNMICKETLCVLKKKI